jgi:hypothetical protein
MNTARGRVSAPPCGEFQQQTMYGTRLALWALGATAFFLTFVLFTARAEVAGIVCFLITITAPGAAEVYADRRKQKEWFSCQFGTFEDFRAAEGGEPLRQLRLAHGDIAAVRRLRMVYPLLPLAQAARLLKEEPVGPQPTGGYPSDAA